MFRSSSHVEFSTVAHGALIQRLAGAHTVAQPAVNSRVRETSLFAPFGKALRHAINRQVDRVALVVVLLLSCCPPAVAGLIVAVDILPIERHSAGSITHVGVEVLERHPPLADLDASAAVEREVPLVSMVEAAIQHRTPSRIGFGFRHAVRPRCHFPGFDEEAAARSCLALPKQGSAHDFLSAAVALAEPETKSVSGRLSFDDCQAAEFLAGEFDHLHGLKANSEINSKYTTISTLSCLKYRPFFREQ